jgi:hypothetical protein
MPTRIEPTTVALSQIGQGTILAISGGRVLYATRDDLPTVVLPVRYGYAVEVAYEPGRDTYTVRRTFTRGLKRWVKAEWTDVYATDLSETAYRASCYLDA